MPGRSKSSTTSRFGVASAGWDLWPAASTCGLSSTSRIAGLQPAPNRTSSVLQRTSGTGIRCFMSVADVESRDELSRRSQPATTLVDEKNTQPCDENNYAPKPRNASPHPAGQVGVDWHAEHF